MCRHAPIYISDPFHSKGTFCRNPTELQGPISEEERSQVTLSLIEVHGQSTCSMTLLDFSSTACTSHDCTNYAWGSFRCYLCRTAVRRLVCSVHGTSSMCAICLGMDTEVTLLAKNSALCQLSSTCCAGKLTPATKPAVTLLHVQATCAKRERENNTTKVAKR